MHSSADRKTYLVTERAGPRVADRPVRPGDELQLTEAEARTDELAGVIVAKGRKLAAVYAKPSKGLSAIQARARGLDVDDEETPAPAPAAAGAAPPVE